MTETRSQTTYIEGTAGGNTNREDLGNVLFMVSPWETPGLSAMKRNSATATSHDWPVDKLRAAKSNAVLEGADAAGAPAAARTRLANTLQIIEGTAEVSGSQEKVMKAGGVTSELNHQTVKEGKSMKTDFEYEVFGLATGKVGGDVSTARKMGGLTSYLSGDSFLSAGGDGTAPTGNGVMGSYAPGTGTDFTEELLKTASSALWQRSNGGESIMALMGPYNRSVFSTFPGIGLERRVSTDDAKLQASLAVYSGDYHVITAVPDRFTRENACYLVDPEYLACSELRSFNTKDLAHIGDSVRRQLIWECTLEVCNPDAHAVIDGLTTSA